MAVIMTYDEAEEAARVAGAKHRLARKDLRYAAQLELIEEVRGLRADVCALRQDHTLIARLLDRWDGDGLPGTSAANEASDAAERAAESTRRASRSAHRSWA